MVTKSARWLLLVWLGAFAGLGGYYACSDDTDPPGVDQGTDGATEDGAAEDAAKDTAEDGFIDAVSSDGPGPTITGTIVTLLGSQALAGVQVCVEEDSAIPCVTSTAAGSYAISGLDMTKDFTLSMTKTDYLTGHFPVGANQVAMMVDGTMMADTTVTMLFQALGLTPTAGTGHVLISADASNGLGQSDVTFTLDKTAGEGPFYLNGIGLPDKTLTATSSNGKGALVNLPPGSYEVTFTAPSGVTCSVSHGWKGSTADASKITIVANEATFFRLACK